MRPALILLASMSIAGALPAQAARRQDSATVLTTSGFGEVLLPPDRAIIRFTAASRAQTAEQATQQNALRLRRLLDSLNAVRQPEESVQVVGVTLRPHENYQTGEITNYEAAALVRIRVRQLDRLAQILNVALSSGATGVSEIAFESDRTDAARADALARAYARARASAEALAHAAGMELGPLLSLSTESDSSEPLPFSRRGIEVSGITVTGGADVTPQDVPVRASVFATWRVGANRPR